MTRMKARRHGYFTQIARISQIFFRTRIARKRRGYEPFSLSLAVHVSPAGRRSVVAGARLAWRDKISKKIEKDENFNLFVSFVRFVFAKNICEIRAICVK